MSIELSEAFCTLYNNIIRNAPKSVNQNDLNCIESFYQRRLYEFQNCKVNCRVYTISIILHEICLFTS